MEAATATRADVSAEMAKRICEECGPASLGIYMVIQSFKKDGQANGRLPCQAKIAKRAGVKPSTVRRHLTWLSEAGFLNGIERMKLTERQRDVLEFIEKYYDEHHCSPTIDEVREGCGFGSYRTAWEKVSALDRKGFIEKEMYKERGIRLE